MFYIGSLDDALRDALQVKAKDVSTPTIIEDNIFMTLVKLRLCTMKLLIEETIKIINRITSRFYTQNVDVAIERTLS